MAAIANNPKVTEKVANKTQKGKNKRATNCHRAHYANLQITNFIFFVYCFLSSFAVAVTAVVIAIAIVVVVVESIIFDCAQSLSA